MHIAAPAILNVDAIAPAIGRPTLDGAAPFMAASVAVFTLLGAQNVLFEPVSVSTALVRVAAIAEIVPNDGVACADAVSFIAVGSFVALRPPGAPRPPDIAAPAILRLCSQALSAALDIPAPAIAR